MARIQQSEISEMKIIHSLPQVHLISLVEIVEKRQVALVTSAPAWTAVEGKLHLPIAWQTEVFEATTENWDAFPQVSKERWFIQSVAD